ncbi:DsbA family oxidoreductase [Xanthomonadaceae bacterium XH05]|nr:DsbA family oxidoreductase [Xanthomonadaceae bacterium XH05]
MNPSVERQSPVELRIDFVSDVVCPWCAIGLESLLQALARVKDVVAAEIHVQPFELNPGIAAGGERVEEHLQRKYGMSDAQLQESQEAIRVRGAELGFVFDMQKRSHLYNTFDAHRLLHWAQGEGRQLALKRALLRAYFSEGKNISDHAQLIEVAVQAGLSGEAAAQVLASPLFGEEVREAVQFFQQAGIRSVPAIIINRKHLISGGQPVDVFEKALRQIAATI